MMLMEIGPAALVLRGEKDGRDYAFDRETVVSRVEALLADIRGCLPVLKQRAGRIKKTGALPSVARKMIAAASAIDADTLTPMAAVAGAVADELRKSLLQDGLEFLSVNNGGDIAVYNARSRPVVIGIGNIEIGRPTPYRLRIEGLPDFGVATSGFGGRSFTLGLADIVTVVAASASLADAAATYICNNTSVEDPAVLRERAADLDPLTDIPEERVTVKVGALSPQSIREALARGRAAAAGLKKDGRIGEAVLLMRGETATTICASKNIRLEVSDGNPKDRDGNRGCFFGGRKETA
jgi:uncharacterized protein